MKAQIELKDNNYQETINTEEITDKNNFIYIDGDNATNIVKVSDNGLLIKRKAITHSTTVFLDIKGESYVDVKTNEGNIKIDAKVLEYCVNNDIISLVYKIDDEVKSIRIRYLGV